MTIENLQIFVPWAVAIGSSIITGHPYYDPIPGFYTNQNPTSIGHFLEDFSDDKLTVLNQGLGGNDLDDVQSRWATMVTPFAPNILIIDGAINSIASGESLEDLQTDMAAIYALLPDDTDLYALECGPASSFSSGQNTIKDNYNAWLLTWAEPYPRVHIVQYHDAVEGTADEIHALLTPDSDPGVHYNRSGCRLIAKKVWSAITGYGRSD